MFDKCEYDGCELAAQFAPKICVPAMGWPRDEKKSLQVLLSIKACKEHCQNFDTSKMFDINEKDNLRKVFEIMARTSGSSIPPDFEKVFVICVPLDSIEYERMRSVTRS